MKIHIQRNTNEMLWLKLLDPEPPSLVMSMELSSKQVCSDHSLQAVGLCFVAGILARATELWLGCQDENWTSGMLLSMIQFLQIVCCITLLCGRTLGDWAALEDCEYCVEWGTRSVQFYQSTLFQRMTYWTFPVIAVPSLSTAFLEIHSSKMALGQ